MDFFERVFGWNLDAGSGAAEWLVLAGVVLVLFVAVATLLRRMHRARAAGPARTAHPAPVALSREG